MKAIRRQQGAVLVIAVIFLTVLLLLGAATMRTTQSTESIAGAARLNELATQAAEVALRHCEQSLVEVMNVARGLPPAYATTFDAAHILPRTQVDAWQSVDAWDHATVPIYTLPLSMLNQSGLARDTYKRAPECLVAPVATRPTGSATLSDTATFVITVRGFGPEVSAVPAGATDRRPDGTEVWLQSHVTLE